jgi:hypothetical protein
LCAASIAFHFSKLSAGATRHDSLEVRDVLRLQRFRSASWQARRPRPGPRAAKAAVDRLTNRSATGTWQLRPVRGIGEVTHDQRAQAEALVARKQEARIGRDPGTAEMHTKLVEKRRVGPDAASPTG